MLLRSALVVSLLTVACAGADPGPGTETTVAETAPPPAPTTTSPLVGGCDQEGRFSEGGVVATFDLEDSDSSSIGPITWEATSGCETFTIAFETPEAAPATTPPSTRVEYLDPAPVLRIFTTVEGSVITDQLVETPLVDRLFVVDAPGEGSFIDIHLAGPAQAQASVATSPARVVVSLQPGIVEHLSKPAKTDRVVLVRPLDGSATSPRLAVDGYARVEELVVIATAGGSVVSEESEALGANGTRWVAFELELDLPPGPTMLFAGEQGGDGGLTGVTITLEVG